MKTQAAAALRVSSSALPETTRATATARSVLRDRDLAGRSTAVDQYFALLQQCIAECGWSIEALAEEMRLDKGYLWRLLNQEKPWRPEYEIALPDDVEALFAQRRAESFGRIVVEPAAPERAAQQLVAGLIGLLSPRLPARADRMAKMPEPER